MRRYYYYRADYNGTTVTDDLGEEFPSLQEAKAHGARVAAELSRNSSVAVTVFVLWKTERSWRRNLLPT